MSQKENENGVTTLINSIEFTLEKKKIYYIIPSTFDSIKNQCFVL